MKNKLTQSIAIVLLLILSLPLRGQVLARMNVKSGNSKRVNTTVNATIRLSLLPVTDSLQLFEVLRDRSVPTPFQIIGDKLYWIMSGVTAPGNTRKYELRKALPEVPSVAMHVTDSNGALVLGKGSRKLLQYNYSIAEPPAGVDKIYRRSGFIHPLWAPDGQIITNIHPKGHWHHMGIWNPWTHTSFRGKETDFWNLHKKEGTVRFKGLIGKTAGPVICGFKALQEHIAFIDKEETVAMTEEWTVNVFHPGTDTTRFIWDLSSILNCADTAGITFLQYRYGGGFGLRTTAAWTATNSEVVTSEGNTRNNADSTRARWIKITGHTDKGQAGLVIMNHPDDFDAPQPVRVWPANSERGEIMMNFSPTKMKAWQLKYGQYYQQAYRVVTFVNDLTKEEVEELWLDYVRPPEVTVYQQEPPSR
ncbi:DUF6807 domain-containing protein [Chitinophaga rhizophila]|uniref:PmoA family protein n=1 Tax=Chitinophaga rhizophila TaxID=2866212 RepID=A0ABS7GCJ8_9BACT|nr:PmoA family protein [Chitinophaga rhizophila]MBW8685005.1 PmoA family protein [Chitinophaga rhizophila]